MDSLDGVKKRLAYAENNNLFDAHYIDDMKHLLRLNELSTQYVRDLKKQSEEFRQEAKNERELSESIVADREELYKIVDELQKHNAGLIEALNEFKTDTFDPIEKEYHELKAIINKYKINIPEVTENANRKQSTNKN